MIVCVTLAVNTDNCVIGIHHRRYTYIAADDDELA